MCVCVCVCVWLSLLCVYVYVYACMARDLLVGYFKGDEGLDGQVVAAGRVRSQPGVAAMVTVVCFGRVIATLFQMQAWWARFQIHAAQRSGGWTTQTTHSFTRSRQPATIHTAWCRLLERQGEQATRYDRHWLHCQHNAQARELVHPNHNRSNFEI